MPTGITGSSGFIGSYLTDWAVLDISKAGRECGWQPGVGLSAGIHAMMEAWRGRAAAGPVASLR
jgi:nucleoside-diphosphate-sugar epimerase